MKNDFMDYKNSLAHSKGPWKKHKYSRIVNGEYVYDQASNAVNNVKKAASGITGTVKDTYKIVRKKADDAKEKAKEVSGNVKDKASRAAEYVKPEFDKSDATWDNLNRKHYQVWNEAAGDLNKNGKVIGYGKGITIGNKTINGGIAEDGSLNLDIYTDKDKKSLTESAKDKSKKAYSYLKKKVKK